MTWLNESPLSRSMLTKTDNNPPKNRFLLLFVVQCQLMLSQRVGCQITPWIAGVRTLRTSMLLSLVKFAHMALREIKYINTNTKYLLPRLQKMPKDFICRVVLLREISATFYITIHQIDLLNPLHASCWKMLSAKWHPFCPKWPPFCRQHFQKYFLELILYSFPY